MAFRSLDRNSQFFSLLIMGKQLHVELHPNKTTGGTFRIKSVAEGEALIGRLQEGIDALADAERAESEARIAANIAESEAGDANTG